jgi:hypothetical protein
MYTERQLRAIRAARAIAARHGLRSAEPRLLSDCNNTIVHLVPWPVVAKVADTNGRPAAPMRLRRELEVALHAARAGAPVVAPSAELPIRVHRHGDHVLTFWTYQRHVPSGEPAAGTLHEIHRAIQTYPGELPAFRPLPDAHGLRVPEPERSLLIREHTRLGTALEGRSVPWRPLHGDPHRGNLLVTAAGSLWIDFESACLGPLEWDLSALPGDDAEAWRAVDPELLALLRRARSLRTVVWCRTRAGSGPEVQRAAATHLELLRAA